MNRLELHWISSSGQLSSLPSLHCELVEKTAENCFRQLLFDFDTYTKAASTLSEIHEGKGRLLMLNNKWHVLILCWSGVQVSCRKKQYYFECGKVAGTAEAKKSDDQLIKLRLHVEQTFKPLLRFPVLLSEANIQLSTTLDVAYWCSKELFSNSNILRLNFTVVISKNCAAMWWGICSIYSDETQPMIPFEGYRLPVVQYQKCGRGHTVQSSNDSLHICAFESWPYFSTIPRVQNDQDATVL